MPIEPRVYPLRSLDEHALAAEAAGGLMARPARVCPKFLYDTLGSRLFDAITELPSYYPTRTERAVLDQWAPDMVASVLGRTGAGPVMIDLGAGSCTKAARLFERLAPCRYVAVDISVDHLKQSLRSLQREYPDIEMIGVGQDFSTQLRLPPELTAPRSLVFYPGSSIGNFAPDEALRLLRDMRAAAAGGALLIGVDLVKPRNLLEAAYDDDLGVTAAFNLNVLQHLNHLLGADFRVRDWRHVAFFDPESSRIEMHLEARAAVTIRWAGAERSFLAGERIHTENSYKWTPESFGALLRDAGYRGVSHWTDPQSWFAVFVAHA
jgi:L-histidine Nalpha-methyltransferase